MTDNITLPRQTAQQILAALRVAVTPVPKDRQEVLRLDAALQTALAQPIPTHRIASWGHCGVCRHDRIPGEGCARQECPDSPQQQAEPVAYDKTELNSFVMDLYDRKMQEGKHGHYETMFHVVHEAVKRFAPPQQQAEPVGEVDAIGLNGTDFHVSFTRPMPLGTKLYTTPPQRKPLTVDELQSVLDRCEDNRIAVARAIEAAHGIKEGA